MIGLHDCCKGITKEQLFGQNSIYLKIQVFVKPESFKNIFFI